MASHPRISKAVIPAAGLGTRFLPATKATPKEMLPVVDKPAIQYVVEEAASAGLDDVLMITGRNKRPLEDHFDRNYELESALQKKGDADRLAKVQESSDLATMHYVRQGDPKGLGHAVLCAAPHVGHEPFAVLLGDDLIDPRDPLLARMVEVQEQHGGSVIALEKPDPADAPSNYAVIGRYVLDPHVFDILRKTEPGRGGEIQLTDALQQLAQDEKVGGPVHGVVFKGRRYDTGDRSDYLRAIVRLACEREDLGPDFRTWLRSYVAEEIPGNA
jgi:UTP--glucose-1-phosphate uridylyltransferase